jgi:hypothetical protein
VKKTRIKSKNPSLLNGFKTALLWINDPDISVEEESEFQFLIVDTKHTDDDETWFLSERGLQLDENYLHHW